jgi:Tol biopolymer transport system component
VVFSREFTAFRVMAATKKQNDAPLDKDVDSRRSFLSVQRGLMRKDTLWPWAAAILCLVVAAIVFSASQAPQIRRDYRLTLVDREGRRTLVGMVPGSTFAPRISPDGSEVVFDTSDDGAIWIAKLSDVASKRRLTTEGRNRGPMWSGDGRRILYVTDHEGAETLFWRNVDGAGMPELLVAFIPAKVEKSDCAQNGTRRNPGDRE